MYNEQQLISQLMQSDEKAFTLLFRKYYTDLVLFAGSYLPHRETCEDIVQNVFLSLWAKRYETEIKTSLKSFLLKSVRNGCFDELRHQKVVFEHQAFCHAFENSTDFSTEHYILHSDLSEHLEHALAKLPESYREVFELSRLKGVKYKEIAQELNISERTVEERIGKTIHLLRHHLKDFLHFLVFCIFYR